MRVLHGMREVAGQAYYSVKGLRRQGCRADLILWDPSPFGYPVDKCLNIDFANKKKYPWYVIKLGCNFISSLFKYDVFHFHFGHSLLPFGIDLPVLKLFRKKIICEFHGDDVRNPQFIKKFYKYVDFEIYMGSQDAKVLKERRSKRVKYIMKYADHVVLHDDELVSHVKAEGLTAISVVPLRLDVNSITPCYPENTNEKRINIVHAPSGNGKGTKWFLEAMEKLSQKHNINLILIRNLPQQEAFKEYMKADIIFDQITVGTYGVFAIEAMAMGKPVITYISEDMKKKLPKDLPIVSATPDSLYGVLESLILDSELRNHLGKQGRQYACKYHDCGNNAAVLKAIYEGKENGLTGEAAFNQVVRKV